MRQDSLFWVGEVEQKHGQPVLVSKRTCLITDSAFVLVAKDEKVVRHLTLESIGKLVKYQSGWWVVKHREGDLALRTTDAGFEPAFYNKWKQSKLLPQAERALLPRFSLDSVESSELTQSLSVFYQPKQIPEILWAGWVWRRERIQTPVHSKRLLILTCTAMYTGRTRDNTITRCIPLEGITTVSTSPDGEILFKIPMEYDIVLKEPTRGLQRCLEKVFDPIIQIDGPGHPLNGYTLIEPPGYIPAAPLPITAEAEVGRAEEKLNGGVNKPPPPSSSPRGMARKRSLVEKAKGGGGGGAGDVEISFRVPGVDERDADLRVTITSTTRAGNSSGCSSGGSTPKSRGAGHATTHPKGQQARSTPDTAATATPPSGNGTPPLRAGLSPKGQRGGAFPTAGTTFPIDPSAGTGVGGLITGPASGFAGCGGNPRPVGPGVRRNTAPPGPTGGPASLALQSPVGDPGCGAPVPAPAPVVVAPQVPHLSPLNLKSLARQNQQADQVGDQLSPTEQSTDNGVAGGRAYVAKSETNTPTQHTVSTCPAGAPLTPPHDGEEMAADLPLPGVEAARDGGAGGGVGGDPDASRFAVLSPPEGSNSLASSAAVRHSGSMGNGPGVFSNLLLDVRKQASFSTSPSQLGSSRQPGTASGQSHSSTPRVGLQSTTTPTWQSNRTRTSTIASFSGLDVSLPMIDHGGSDTLHWASEVMAQFDKSGVDIPSSDSEDEMGMGGSRGGGASDAYADTMTTVSQISPRRRGDLYIMYLTDTKIKLTTKKYDMEVIAKSFDLSLDGLDPPGQNGLSSNTASLCASRSSFSSPLGPGRRGLLHKVYVQRISPTRCQVKLDIRADDAMLGFENPMITSPVSTVHSRFGPPTSRSSVHEYFIEDYFIFTPTATGRAAKQQKIDEFIRIFERLTGSANSSPQKSLQNSPRMGSKGCDGVGGTAALDSPRLAETYRSDSINADMRCDYEDFDISPGSPSIHGAAAPSVAPNPLGIPVSSASSSSDTSSAGPQRPQGSPRQQGVKVPPLKSLGGGADRPPLSPRGLGSPRGQQQQQQQQRRQKRQRGGGGASPRGPPAGLILQDGLTGLPLVTLPTLDVRMQKELTALYEGGHQPDVLWVGYVKKVMPNKANEPTRVLLVTPRCVYLLAAEAVIVRCLPLETITELRVDLTDMGAASLSLHTPRGLDRLPSDLGLKASSTVVLTCPDQYDLMFRLLHPDAARTFMLVACSVYRAVTGKALAVHHEARINPSAFSLSPPPGWSPPEPVPIDRRRISDL